MANRIQYRRDTAANWTAANPVLALGEPGWETDTKKRKIGDGVTPWASLGYQAADQTTLDTTYGGLYQNFAPANFGKFRAAIARARSGGSPCRISVYGDSNTNGYNAASGSDYTRSYGYRAMQILDGLFGPSKLGPVLPVIRLGGTTSADARFTVGTGWSTYMNDTGPQGPASMGSMQSSGATAGALSYTASNVNAFTVWTPRFSGGGSITIGIDAEATTTVTTSGTSALIATTVTTATVGTHTVNIKGVSGANYVNLVEAYDNTQTNPGLRFGLAGRSGSKTYDWTLAAYSGSVSDPWGPNSMAYGDTVYNPDLVIFNLEINDHTAATSISTYQSNLTTLVGYAKAAHADVMLIASAQGNSGVSTTWSDYRAAILAVAKANGCGVIDMHNRWLPYAQSSVAPYSLWADADHPNAAGYWDMGEAVAGAIKLAAGRSA